MLRRLHVDNFASLVNFDWKPERICLLLGANGAGKSSLPGVLRRIRDVVVWETPVAQVFPSETRTAWQTLPHQVFELDVEGRGGLFRYRLQVRHGGLPKVRIDEESLSKDTRTLYRFDGREAHLYDNRGVEGAHFPVTDQRSYMSSLTERPETEELRWFRDEFLRKIWVGGLAPSAGGSAANEEHAALSHDGSNLPSWYRHLLQERPEKLGEVVEDLRPSIPGLKAFRTPVGDDGQRSLKLAFGAPDDGGAYELSYHQLSDGQRALTALYALIRASDAPMIMIDEPDNFLAVREIRPWLAAAEEWAFAGHQLIVATHNDHAVDHLASNQTLLLRRTNGPTRIEPLEVDLNAGQKASQAALEGPQ